MNVASIMTAKLVSVGMDDSLKVVKDIFDQTGFHHLLVIEHDRLLGVISDRDLLRALSPNVGTINATAHDEAMLRKRAHQIMTRRPLTVQLDTNVYDAIEQIIYHDISCLPVVNASGKPVGILTWRDILAAVMARRYSVEKV